MSKKRKGQSVLEYVIILSVVIAAIVAFATSTLRPKVEGSLNRAANEMEEMVNRIDYGAP